MSNKIAFTALPLAPKEYDLEYMNRLIKQLNITIAKLNAVGPFTCGSDLTDESGAQRAGLVIINVPTSSTGLATGSVWSDGGTLKIVS